jgi:phosphoglycolate phosphatase
VIGPPLRIALQELLGIEPESAEADALGDSYRERSATTLLDTPGFPGIPAVLDALGAAGVPLGVVTSKPLPFAEPVLDALGLRELFTHVEGPRLDGIEGKGETLERALAVLPAAVALVGDRRYDIAAARSHGLLAVGVVWGIGSRAELAEAGADVIVDQPAELLPLLLEASATRASRATSSFTSRP